MNGIFISYRREDAAGHAGRLFDRLAARFGKDSVFMDVEGIEAGVDFVETIEGAVGRCAVLLAVIGRNWLNGKDAQGRRRLDDPQDFVRLETASALGRKVRVIPVLVEGARMPGADELPEDLRGLARRQALELRDSRWEADIQALIGVLERVLAPAASPTAPPRQTSEREGRKRAAWAWQGGAAALLLIGAVAGYRLWPDERAAIPEKPATPIATQTEPRPAAAQPDTPPTAAPQIAPVPQPATQSPAAKRSATAKPAPPDATLATAPVTTPAEAAGPAVRPPAKAKPEAAVAVPAPARTIAIVTLGEPTFRDFWEGERKGPYSAKIAGLYRSVLREVAAGGIEFKINADPERTSRELERALREGKALCESTGASSVFVALVEEPMTTSRAESAYWPDLRLTAIVCDSGKRYDLRDRLSPRNQDGFPFERDMADTMEKFARERSHLLQ